MTDWLERPKLRNIEIFPIQSNGVQYLCLRDPQGLAEQPLIVSSGASFLLTHFDGEHTIGEIQAAFVRRFGQLIFSDKIREFAQTLDRALLLDSPPFHEHVQRQWLEFRETKVRPASHAGVAYPNDATALRQELNSFFEPPAGPGLPMTSVASRPVSENADRMSAAPLRMKKIKAIVAPHIDLRRGGSTYAWAYRELLEAEPVTRFIILGINHVSARHLFTLTCKDFQTPLGAARCDGEAVQFLHAKCGDWIFEDELCHRREHSVEFQVMFLQHLFGDRNGAAQEATPFRIVPVLCSSFLHLLERGQPVESLEEFSQLTTALRELVTDSQENVCLIVSVDLSHVGPRFGDAHALRPAFLSRVDAYDRAFLEKAATLDAEGFLRQIIEADDFSRIDAVPALYAMLKTIDLQGGRLLKYEQSVDDSAQSCVTFASMSFE